MRNIIKQAACTQRQRSRNGADPVSGQVENYDAQNNRSQFRWQSGKQARLLEGPTTIYERSKVTSDPRLPPILCDTATLFALC